MRWIIALAALSFASTAQAAGLGTSITFSQDGFWTYSPTLDLLFDPVVVQIHLAETLDRAFNDELYLGADAVVTVAEVDITNGLRGVFQPGGAMWIYGNPTRVSLAATARVGAEAGTAARIGVYVVPYLGLTIEDGNVQGFASGGAQVAVSFEL